MENSLIPPVASAKLPGESPFRQFSVDQLHQGLVTYENEELVYEHPEQCPTIEIVDENAIEIEGHHIRLTELRVFMVNALRLNQGYAMTAEDFYDLGFRGKDATLKINLQWLMRAMEQGSDEVFIEQERQGNSTRSFYTLLPEVRIVDRRDELQLVPTERLLAECGAINPDGTVRMCENGSIDFAAPRFRTRVNLAMINEYRDKAKVDLAIAQLLDVRIGRRSTQATILPVGDYKLPTPEETAQLFAIKEQALLTYLEILASQEAPTEQQQQTVIAGVRAGYELFARHMDLVGTHARIWARRKTPYQELYQESAMLLMEAVMRGGYDNTGLHNFRFVVSKMIRNHNNRGMVSLHKFFSQVVSYPNEYYKDRPRFIAAEEELRAELGHEPSATAVAERLGTSIDRVLGMAALSQTPDDLNYKNAESSDYLPPQLHLSDFANDLLEKDERQLAIDSIFMSEKLTTAEKVVLSLHYQIFQPALSGIEIQDGKLTYRYPKMPHEFTALTAKPRTLHSLAIDIFGFNSTYASTRHTNALRKARTILKSNPAFDPYGRADTIQARRAAEQEEAERQQIITEAIAVSPNERLGRKELLALSKEKAISFIEADIIRLFGSLPAFQIACGFEPDRIVIFRDLTAQEAVELALTIKPDGPLKFFDIEELSKEGTFPGKGIIAKLFGSIPAFQIACGFEPEKGIVNRNLTAEQVVARALEIKPDGPLGDADIRKYSKEGSFPGNSVIKRLFGSIPDFHVACGFEPSKNVTYRDLTTDEAIKKARTLKPDGPLTQTEIEEYSKQGVFPGDKVIKRLFGSIPDFHVACGFEPPKAAISRNLTAEQVIELALGLKPDGPMGVDDIRRHSKEGNFTSYATVMRHFKNMYAFQKACGFEPTARKPKPQ